MLLFYLWSSNAYTTLYTSTNNNALDCQLLLHAVNMSGFDHSFYYKRKEKLSKKKQKRKKKEA